MDRFPPLLWLLAFFLSFAFLPSSGCQTPPATEDKTSQETVFDRSKEAVPSEETAASEPTFDASEGQPETTEPQNETQEASHEGSTDGPPPECGSPQTPPCGSENPPETPPERGLPPRVPNLTCRFPLPAQPPSIALTPAFPRLPLFARPLFLTFAPSEPKRIYVVEQGGRIASFEHRADVSQTTTFLSISVSRDGNEEGLLGLAFHPRYAQNGFFYVYYSLAGPRRSVLSRFSVSKTDPLKADPASEVRIFELPQPFSNHNGGMIAFGPDGYLYVSLGDGGSGGDPLNSGQDLTTLLGSILRIDVDKPSGGLAYGIPPDNPFIRRGGGVKEEIWAYGLRNVWRFSFDRLTGDLWAGDVGQTAREEIDLIKKGGNYGWRLMEGTLCYNPPRNCPTAGLLLPVKEHDRTEAKSIIGGYIYRGPSLPSLQGAYIYGDFVTGLMWAFRFDGQKAYDFRQIADTRKQIASFGEDFHGEIYVLTFDGLVSRLQVTQAVPPTEPFPKTLSQTQCYRSLSALTPADGLIPYDVISPLWSDSLEKTRYIALPGMEKISFSPDKAWDFPDETVLVKHFSLTAAQTMDGKPRQIETRFLVKQRGGWSGYTYLWRDDQTEADLVEVGQRKSLLIKDPVKPGQGISFSYSVPSRSECFQCHTSQAGFALGLHTAQMNRNFAYKGILDHQLEAMNHIGLFSPPLATPVSSLPKLTSPTDPRAPLEAKARSYLDANCSFCHRADIPTAAEFDLRFHIPFAQMKICDVPPQRGNLGVTDPRLLAPASPERSILLLRMKATNSDRMPNLASQLEDAAATELLRLWIAGLRSCTP